MASFEHAVTRNLQCSICLELMSEPKLLSCSHTFCKLCLIDLLAARAGSNCMSCPVCRAVTDVQDGDVSSLKTNIQLKSLIEDVKDKGHLCDVCEEAESKAVLFCCDCENNMCKTCHEKHDIWTPNKSHKVVSVSDIRQGKVVLKKKVVCIEHVQGEEHECTDVCNTCKTFICVRCRMFDHEKKGHDVQSSKEYTVSSTKEVESLLKKTDAKTKNINGFIASVERQKEKDLKHIEGIKAEADRVYQEELKKLNERKAVVDKKCDAEMEWVRRKYDRKKIESENQLSGIKSASELARKSSKAPLGGDTIAIRDSLCAELKSVLSQKDPDNTVVNATSEYVQTLTFDRAVGGRELVLGNVHYAIWALKENVALPAKSTMNCMMAMPTGEMAIGGNHSKIDILSSVGVLQNTVTHNRSILGMACLSNRRYALTDYNNTIHMFTSNWNKLPSAFETVKFEEGGFSTITVDTHDNFYVSYRKLKKIQVFSVTGGKAMREILSNDYTPGIIHAMQTEGHLLVCNNSTVRVIDKHGEVKCTLDEEDGYPYPAVCQDGSVIVAWVREDNIVTIRRYTSQLVQIATLISNFKIDEQERRWYQMQELLSGEIAFCTTDRLYVFRK